MTIKVIDNFAELVEQIYETLSPEERVEALQQILITFWDEFVEIVKEIGNEI